MIKVVIQQIKPALFSIIVLSILFGLIYPGFITVVAHYIFPDQADGSLIVSDGRVLGSRSIGQYFSDPKYFWGRPSATEPFPYNSLNSTGSNLGPTNPILLEIVKNRIAFLKKSDPNNKILVPIELVTASGSGLDPEISPDAAFFQIHRVAEARNLSDAKVQDLLIAHILPRQFGFLGEPRVNVLELNMALDQIN